MPGQGTSLLDRTAKVRAARFRAIGAEAPPRWFETEGKPFRLPIDVPLSFDEMVAALYEDSFLSPRELVTDEEVRGHIALAVVQDGVRVIERHADAVAESEAAGTVATPWWLAFCRQRVAEVFCPARENGLRR